MKLPGLKTPAAPEQPTAQLFSEAAKAKKKTEQTFAMASAGGRADPRIIELAGAGLGADLGEARRVYEELGDKLDQERMLLKELRPLYVAARRLLEDVWGLTTIREKPRPKDDRVFKLRSPKGVSEFPMAVVGYDMYFVPKGRGAGFYAMRPRGEPYYGPNAPVNAMSMELDVLLNEEEATDKRLNELATRGTETANLERTRLKNKKDRLAARKKELAEAIKAMEKGAVVFKSRLGLK